MHQAHRIHSKDKPRIVREFVKKFPNHGSLTLAKAIYKEHQDLWPTLESVRTSIRSVRGNSGSARRRTMPNDFYRPNAKPGDFAKMPESQAEVWEPLKIDFSRVLLLSDIHLPYHDKRAVTAALKHGKGFNPDCVLLNGDLNDFYALSRYVSNPKLRKLKEEIACVVQFLEHVRGQFPKAHIIWKQGNHEERYEHWMWLKAPEILDVPHFDFANIFQLEKTGVELVRDQRIILLGDKLPILHGHELPKGLSSPVNPARGFFMRTMDTMIAGHLHRSSQHTEPTMMGRNVTCWSTGCLCDMHPQYSRVNKWNQGFAMIESAGGDFRLENLRIHNGKVF